MPTIRIDFHGESQDVEISAQQGCTAAMWSKVRRLFEDRYPQLVDNRHESLIIPFWALLSIRDAFRYVLKVNGVTALDLSETVRRQLVQAKDRETLYAKAAELQSMTVPRDAAGALENAGFERRLLPYQLRNVSRLCGLRAGATFSVPGAGKTTEALAYYFITRDVSDKLLVIAPKNAFVAWEDELPACAPNVPFRFLRLTGGQSRITELLRRDPQAVIISYQQLPRVLPAVVAYLVRNNVYMFVDESHRMKRGYSGVQGSAILNVAHLPKRKLILSGTPMPNSPDDLVSQFSFLYPEKLSTCETVIENLQHIYVRTTKGELGLMPPCRILQQIPMRPGQERLYAALATDAGRHLQGLSVSDRVRFRRFARCVQYMIQAASNPSLLVGTSLAGHDLLTAALKEGLSAKLEYSCGLARKWAEEGHKVVIWSTFVNTLEHLAGLLGDLGAQFIHGGVLTSEDPDAYDSREAKIREFNDTNSACRVLVANPAACSEGISLHRVCHHAIYVDRNYNAAHYLQSEDRIHRIGLPPTTATYVTVLCSPGTVDESVDRRLQSKVDSMRQILNDPHLSVRALDLDAEDELEGLDAQDLADLRRMLEVHT